MLHYILVGAVLGHTSVLAACFRLVVVVGILLPPLSYLNSSSSVFQKPSFRNSVISSMTWGASNAACWISKRAAVTLACNSSFSSLCQQPQHWNRPSESLTLKSPWRTGLWDRLPQASQVQASLLHSGIVTKECNWTPGLYGRSPREPWATGNFEP